MAVADIHNKHYPEKIKWQAACIPRAPSPSRFKVNTTHLSSTPRKMRLTSVCGFVQTAATLAKSGSKAKGEYVLVQCHSVATGFQVGCKG